MCSLNETAMESDHYLAHSACSFTLFLIGTVGNASSIYVIWRGRLYNSTTMALLINLCLANLIISALILPLLGVNGLHKHWLYGDTFCQIFAYVLYVTLSSEFLILMVITVNQYLIVVRNAPRLCQPGHRAKLVLASLSPWLFSATLYLLPLVDLWDKFAFDSRIHMCTLVNLTGILGMKSSIAGCMLLSGMVVITYCYAAIYCVHHRSQRRTHHSREANTDNALVSRTSVNNRNAKLIRMISVIMINFGATYLPFMFMYATDPCLDWTPSSAVVAIIYICMSHSATNPIIYALMNEQIFVQWKQLLTRCLNLPRCPSCFGRHKEVIETAKERF